MSDAICGRQISLSTMLWHPSEKGIRDTSSTELGKPGDPIAIHLVLASV